jgi:predicted kinase
VTPFDGIEFNPNLRWIDVMSELAFLLMDLDDHQRLDLSRCLRDRYLSLTGDYAGLSVLRYYLVYRAMVRAKVAGLQLLQVGKNNQALTAEVENYLQLALDTIGTSTPCLLISHGLSGSGKTFISERLLEQVDLIRLRSDVERKRMFRMAARSRDRSGFEQGIYSKEAGTQTYQRLLELAAIVLEAGYSVLVDAAFLKREQRQLFADYAAQNDIPFLICHSEADIEVQRQRLRERAAADTDASDANVVVLERQLSNHEPLTEEERKATVTVDTTRAVDLQAVLRRLDGTA